MKNIYMVLVFLITAMILQPVGLFSQDYYIKPNGEGNKDGSSWNNAMGNEEFTAALLSATNGDVFHIAAGTYYPTIDVNGLIPDNPRLKTFCLNSGVVLKGGYDANGDVYTGEDNALTQVFLSGDAGLSGDCSDNVYKVITYKEGINNVVLEGINIIGVHDTCSGNNIILFKEDFGGNNASDTRVSLNPLPGNIITDYPFSSENENTPHPKGIYYWLFKSNSNKFGSINSSKATWHTGFDDQTSPNDMSSGYMLAVETGRNTKTIYERAIDNLCGTVQLYFSVKLGDLSVELPYTNGWEQDPILKFELLGENDSTLITYITGKLPRDAEGEFKWRTYGFPFILPQTISTIKLRISNYLTTGWQEAAFVMDDIQIAYYSPPVAINAVDEFGVNIDNLCETSYLKIQGSYEDTGVYGDDLTALVEFKSLGSDAWTALATNVNKLVNPVDILWSTNSFKKAHEGYYRIRVGNTATINSPVFSTISDSVFVGFKPTLVLPDIRVQLCKTPEREIQLSSYLDTANINFLGWKKTSETSPGFVAGSELTTGAVNSDDFELGNYIYKYKAQGECNVDSAKLYITYKESAKSHVDTLVVCKEDDSAMRLNLKRILGIEAAGRWVYDSTINPDNVVSANVTIVQAPAINAGTYMFNAINAWYDATDTKYLIPGGYNGDMNSKLFKIHYIIDDKSNCFANTVNEIVIIVTENLMP